MRLNQNQNKSINSILYHGHLLEKIVLWYRLLYESEFNDGTNYRYHLRNHHKELEQLKNI